MNAALLNGLREDDSASGAVHEIVVSELERLGWEVDASDEEERGAKEAA